MATGTPSITINELLPDQFTKLDYQIIPPNSNLLNGDPKLSKAAHIAIGKLIDHLGVQSATAQGLGKVVTSVAKMRAARSHYIYLMKDHEADDAHGEVLGLLKIGYKHLFLHDATGKLHEVEPPCVLDFYVVSTHRRQGYGRALFNYMLHDLNLKIADIAIDGPSEAFINFFRRNYGVENLTKQNNNFAIAPGFFENIESGTSNVRTGPPVSSPQTGAFSLNRPISTISSGCFYFTDLCGERRRHLAGVGDYLTGAKVNRPWLEPLSGMQATLIIQAKSEVLQAVLLEGATPPALPNCHGDNTQWSPTQHREYSHDSDSSDCEEGAACGPANPGHEN